MKQKLQFTLEGQVGNARAGSIELNGHTLKTPVFMPVWTKATIKGLFLDMLRNPDYLGDLDELNIILANTFHLSLRPGENLIQEAGWVQEFMNWPWLVLTDSGWFQLFSLWLNKVGNPSMSKKWPLVSLREEGIKYKSPIDWSSHFMTPESCVDIQTALGSDIMMMLDVCSPWWSDMRIYKKHLQQTHRRAQRQFSYYQNNYDNIRGVLFPIVQWWVDIWLRQESIDYLSAFASDGIAVGGVSVGESREQIQQIVEFCWPRLPSHVPRYLMGVGDWKTIRFAIQAGFDMFDCVMPTRLWRHGVMYTDEGQDHLTNTRFRNDHSPLWWSAKNNLSKKYTKAYVHHLLREKEMLGWLILSLHNIFFLHQKIGELREGILAWRDISYEQ